MKARSNTRDVNDSTTHPLGPSRSLSIKVNPRSTRGHAIAPSSTKLFITNLRLLDLDLSPDCPNITVQTFSARDADQKQRIAAVEWALVRLFEIWDPVETNQRLRPFFPPLEPVQSRNLRIALHRCLEGLKKDGLLCRESVLRKTMLDECKGEKFFEILAQFSNLVLKKVLASQQQDVTHEAIAADLATQSRLSVETQPSVLPLTMAHKYALAKSLRTKQMHRANYQKFATLLNAKAEKINGEGQTVIKTDQALSVAASSEETHKISKLMQNNCAGEPNWFDVICHGDSTDTDEEVLDKPFDDIWRSLDMGFQICKARSSTNLMVDLQSRVNEQRRQLEKWRKLHDKLQNEASAVTPTSPKVPVPLQQFQCTEHTQLHLHAREGVVDSSARSALSPEIQTIIATFDRQLSMTSTANYSSLVKSSQQTGYGSCPPSSTVDIQGESRVTSESGHLLCQLEQSHATPVPRTVHVVDHEDRQHEHILDDHLSRMLTSQNKSVDKFAEGPFTKLSDSSSRHLTPHTWPPVMEQLTAPSQTMPHLPAVPTVLAAPQLTSEEAMAAQIIRSIDDASPSPIKNAPLRPTLAERTRMSMAHMDHSEPTTEVLASAHSMISTGPIMPADDKPDRQVPLMERTRQSIDLNTQNRARASVSSSDFDKERKVKTSRRSNFPINQFDTPRSRKSLPTVEESKSSEKTPQEALFGDEIDYARVFKSRPRIATSPVGVTPGKLADDDDHWDMCNEEVTGIDLNDIDQGDSDIEDHTGFWQVSPLKGRKTGGMHS